MRPGKADYDRYLAILQFGRSVGWDDRRIRDEGPFLTADPGITFILLRAHRDLAAIGRALGEPVAEIEAEVAALEAATEHLWNPDLGAYDAREARSGRFAGNLSSAAFLAGYAGISRAELEARLMRAWDAVRYGIPSADPEDPGFEPRRYWRGPSWPVLNALIARGFADSGRGDLAERLRRETAALIAAGGFYEYFDPLDGTACGGKNFTWTAAIWLGWASPSAGET
jgi:glycogen debranching enzyme